MRALFPATVAALMLASAPLAMAGEADNLVAFGDSFAANPGHVSSVESLGGCPNAIDNYSALAATQLGLEVRSFACNGAIAMQDNDKNISHQIDRAIERSALGESTKLVTITVGANDTAQNMLRMDMDTVFTEALVGHIERIKAHAPNAQVQVVGYPEFSDDAGMVCASNIAGVSHPVHAPVVRELENALEKRHEAAAQATGATFVSMKEASPQAMCGPDGSRHMSGVLDTDFGSYNMLFHPTAAGSRAIADEVVQAFKDA